MMTDREMQKLGLEEWYGILGNLWIAVGKEIEQARFKIYASALKDVPMGLLELAIGRVLSERVYAGVPQLGEIHKAIQAELAVANCPGIPQWLEKQWSRLIPPA
jgi:hypothetical protein